MTKQAIYRVYNQQGENIFEGVLDATEKKMFKSKGYQIVKTNSFVTGRGY